MTQRSLKIVQTVKSDGGIKSPQDDDMAVRQRKLCTRGLEPYIEKNACQRKEEQNQAWNSVLDIQDMQMDLGIYNEYEIRLAYLSYNLSMDVAKQANERALQDAKTVSKYISSST